MCKTISFVTILLSCFGGLHAEPFPVATTQSEIIFANGFEEDPQTIRVIDELPRIEFVSDRSLLLTMDNPEARVAAVVLDSSGDPVDGAQITWSTNADGILEITPIGLRSAIIRANGAFNESLKVSAKYAPLGIEQVFYVSQAELAPGAVLLPSVNVPESGRAPDSEDELIIEVQGDRFAEHVLVLRRIPRTLSLESGDILLTGDYAGILVRVLDARPGDESVELSVEPTAITNAISDVTLTFQSSRARLDGVFSGRRSKRESSNRNTDSGAIKAAEILDNLECNGSAEFKQKIDFSGMEVNPSLSETGELSISQGTIDRFIIRADYIFRLVGALGLNLDSSIQAAASCTARFRPIAFKGIPISAIQIRPLITPIAGVSGELSAEASGKVQSPRRGVEFTGFGSVRYTAAEGWTLDGDATKTDIEDGVFDTDLAGQLTVRGTASAGAIGGLAIDLGKGRASLEILNFGLVRGDFAVSSQLSAESFPSSTNYAGPQASIATSQTVSGTFSAELFNGTLGEYLGLSIESDLSIELFPPLTQPVLVQPGFLARLENAPSGNEFSPGDQLTYIISALSGQTGTSGSVELLVARPNATSAEQIATFPVANGSGRVTLPIDQFEPGAYILLSRISLDGALFQYTETLPLAGDPNVSFTVLP